jgi:hypothetical protein
MISVLDELEELELSILMMENKENISDMRNRRFLTGEMRLKINRLTEEYEKLEKNFKLMNK